MAAARRQRIAEMNVVPYVDVMLVLLIIFMVSAPLLTQGFEVKLPQVSAPTVALSDPIKVSMLADRTLRINVGQDPERPASLKTVAQRVRAILARNPDLAVLIEGDASVPYGEMMSLLGTLNAAGIHDVGLVTSPEITP